MESLSCLPASGNEELVVENHVKALKRKWSTSVPQMRDMDELNVDLSECCVRGRDRNSSGKTETSGVRFEHRNTPLTESQQAANRERSTIRVRDEHVIGSQLQLAGDLLQPTIGITRGRTTIGLRSLDYV